jgi:predicted enzyme related to lactoylglutathione lyase
MPRINALEVSLHVADVARSVAFYAEVLGPVALPARFTYRVAAFECP